MRGVFGKLCVIGKSVKHKFLSDLHPDYLNKVLYFLNSASPVIIDAEYFSAVAAAKQSAYEMAN
jgi:hypothetical protein